MWMNGSGASVPFRGEHAVKMSCDARQLEVLMVEDSLTFARVTMGALKKGEIDHRMTWLRDGNDALEFLYRTGRFAHAPRPDLILLDLSLPGLDGRELLVEIKSDGDMRQIPLVVMTASTDETDRLRCEELAVDAYLTKPVDLDKFLWLIRRLRRFWRDATLLSTVNAIDER